MLWADEAGRTRRPIVTIEDHLYHTAEMLDAIAAAAPATLAHITVCVLDRPGPDTDSALAEWASRYPGIAIVTMGELSATSLGGFARDVARHLRPGGILLQDVQLETLPFVPADRWWESIYLGATIRGLFPTRAPLVRFCSNKRGYDATFGKDLLDAGFDPRDVLDKGAMREVVVPTLLRLLAGQFPRELTVGRAGGTRTLPVADADRAEVDADCDLVLWTTSGGAALGGRAMASPATIKAGSPEIDTWRALLSDHLQAGSGVEVVAVGARLGGTDAERAEWTNLAARHIHGLRARLRDPESIVTAHHRYRLADHLTVAMV